jgi:hypothetical protein
MNIKRAAVTLALFAAAGCAGVSTASAATVPASPMPVVDHASWCGQQHWDRGDQRWQQCKDVHGWWDNNCYNNNDNHAGRDNNCDDNAYTGAGHDNQDHAYDPGHGAVTGRRQH